MLMLKILMHILAPKYKARKNKGYYFTPLDFHESLYIRVFRKFVRESQKSAEPMKGSRVQRMLLF
jgi:hypothetical protein